jgi:hypothetical protein
MVAEKSDNKYRNIETQHEHQEQHEENSAFRLHQDKCAGDYAKWFVPLTIQTVMLTTVYDAARHDHIKLLFNNFK